MRLDDGGDHRLSLAARDWSIELLKGAASVRDVQEPEKTRLRGILREMPGRWFPGSIGVLAGGIAEGEQHFLMHASCTPWDHAPVDLLCREAGAHAAMIDGGGRYDAGKRSGFMVAPDPLPGICCTGIFGKMAASRQWGGSWLPATALPSRLATYHPWIFQFCQHDARYI